MLINLIILQSGNNSSKLLLLKCQKQLTTQQWKPQVATQISARSAALKRNLPNQFYR